MSAGGIVIIGGGQAASVATRTLRRRGYDGTVTIVGDEPDLPYQRPPLSKEYLTDEDESGLWLLPQVWTDANDVVVRTATAATRIDTAAGGVQLADGSTLAADSVLVATGGRPRGIAGARGGRIHTLRTKADADRLRLALRPGSRVVIIGAGFIGAEVSSSARRMGAEVTVLEASPVPLQRVLGERLGTVCAAIQRDAGVDLRLGVAVDSIRETDQEVIVETSTGPVVGDLAVVAIGIIPNQEIGEASGLTVGNGIHVDEYCRTSAPNVYAAGDVANHYHPLFDMRMRVEHFDNASKQAAAAANNMLGRPTVFADPHWFWSDQFGLNLQCVGHPSPDHEMVVRGDLDGRDFTAFFLDEGRVRAAFTMGRPDDIAVARELVSAGISLPADSLADDGYDLFDALEGADA